MNFKVGLQPSGAEFTARADRTLLEAALEAGFFPPHSCRSGSCGACKNQLISGHIEQGPAMFSVLSAAERARGAFLFCCARPLSDLVIERRDIELPGEIRFKRLQARVRAKLLLSPHLMRLTLELPSNRRLCFRAGQTVEILCPDGSRMHCPLQGESMRGGELSLDVERAASGSNPSLFETKIGDNLRVEGPYDTDAKADTSSIGGGSHSYSGIS